MRTIWRALVIWLTVLAVPVQGFAAAGMLHCISMGEVASQQHAHAHGADALAPHDHAPGGARAHAVHDADAGTEAGAGAPEGRLAGVGHKCSACAACHLGVALLPSSVCLPELQAAPAPVLALEIQPVSFVTGGPDRPPRRNLA